MMDSNNSPRGIPNLQFDPDLHPHSTLKAFNDFVEQFEFRYEAQYPEPSKTVMDNAVLQWKSLHQDADPSAAQKIIIRNNLISKDKVRKLLGFFSTLRFQQDWKAAEPTEAERNCTWTAFLTKMRTYYKPTENTTLRNFEFRSLTQLPAETFSAFSNRIEKEGKTCTFCECDATSDCNASEMAIRDQIVVGTNNEKIREQALLKSWKLAELRTEGMKLESASRGEEKLSHSSAVNKVGKYSYKNSSNEPKDRTTSKSNKQCYRCGDPFSGGHMRNCPELKARCSGCKKVGHYVAVCKSKDVNATSSTHQPENLEEEDCEDTYTLNIWRVKTAQSNPRFQSKMRKKGVDDDFDFHARILVKNKLVRILADTGAKVSVIGMKQAKDWGLLSLL